MRPFDEVIRLKPILTFLPCLSNYAIERPRARLSEAIIGSHKHFYKPNIHQKGPKDTKKGWYIGRKPILGQCGTVSGRSRKPIFRDFDDFGDFGQIMPSNGQITLSNDLLQGSQILSEALLQGKNASKVNQIH